MIVNIIPFRIFWLLMIVNIIPFRTFWLPTIVYLLTFHEVCFEHPIVYTTQLSICWLSIGYIISTIPLGTFWLSHWVHFDYPSGYILTIPFGTFWLSHWVHFDYPTGYILTIPFGTFWPSHWVHFDYPIGYILTITFGYVLTSHVCVGFDFAMLVYTCARIPFSSCLSLLLVTSHTWNETTKKLFSRWLISMSAATPKDRDLDWLFSLHL